MKMPYQKPIFRAVAPDPVVLAESQKTREQTQATPQKSRHKPA